MHVLLLKPEVEARHTLAFFLEAQLKAQVRESASAEEALSLLKSQNAAKFSAIVCDDVAANQPVFDYLKSQGAPKNLVLIGKPGASPGQASAALVAARVDPAKVTEQLKAALANLSAQPQTAAVAAPKVARQQQVVPATAGYVRIHSTLVTRVLPLSADVFVKLADDKFVKVFRAGETTEEQEVRKFLAGKPIEFFWIPASAADEFMAKLKLGLEKVADGAGSEDEAAAAASNVAHAVHELGHKLGFTPEVQEMAKQGVKLALRSIGSSPQLTKILRHLSAERDKYITSHSVFTAQVACSLAAAMKWPSGSTFQKLTYAAFFHDMVLKNQEMAKLRDTADLEAHASEYTEEELKNYRTHPAAAVQLLKKFTEIPSDVDEVILQHHERPDGTGFPRKMMSAQMFPLACVFIVAHDLVDYLFDHGVDGFDGFLSSYRIKYAKGQFRKILEALEALRGTLK